MNIFKKYIELTKKYILENKKELQLNNSETSTLDVYQSEPFWKKINNLEVFEKTKHNLVRMVIPPANGSKLCKYLENQHSYYVDCEKDYIYAYSDYSIKFPAIVRQNNFYGIQFHPEKSNQNGFELLNNMQIFLPGEHFYNQFQQFDDKF